MKIPSVQTEAHALSDFVTKLSSKGISDAKVDTGKDGGFPVQIHLPQEETLIQVEENQTHVL